MNVVETIQQKICLHVHIKLPIPDIVLKTSITITLQSNNNEIHTRGHHNKANKIILNSTNNKTSEIQVMYSHSRCKSRKANLETVSFGAGIIAARQLVQHRQKKKNINMCC